MKNIKEFYEALANDKEMQERAKAMNSEKPENEEAALAAVVEFAEKEGYDFTADQLKTYVEEQKTKELTDEELEQAAGGGSLFEMERVIKCICTYPGYGDA